MKNPQLYSLQDIRQQFQKPFDQEEPYAWLVARRISVFLTYFLQRSSIRPNTVTLVALLVGVVAGGLLAFETVQWRLVAVVCLQLWYVLDCVDGELARIKRDFSNLGVYLDYLMHYFVDTSVLLALAIAAQRSQLPWYWSAALVYGTVACVLGKLLTDLAFKLVVETREGKRQALANPLTRSYSNPLGKLVGIYPRPGYVWHSVPMYLAISGGVVLQWVSGVDMVVQIGALYGIVHLVSLVLCFIGVVFRGSVASGKWLIKFDN